MLAAEAASLADLSRNYRLTVGYQAITTDGGLSRWIYTLEGSEIGALKLGVQAGRIITCQGPVHDVDTGKKIGYALYAQLASGAPRISQRARDKSTTEYTRELELV